MTYYRLITYFVCSLLFSFTTNAKETSRKPASDRVWIYECQYRGSLDGDDPSGKYMWYYIAGAKADNGFDFSCVSIDHVGYLCAQVLGKDNKKVDCDKDNIAKTASYLNQ